MKYQDLKCVKKIGNTTFIVYAKQSKKAEKSLETVFREMCINEICDE